MRLLLQNLERKTLPNKPPGATCCAWLQVFSGIRSGWTWDSALLVADKICHNPHWGRHFYCPREGGSTRIQRGFEQKHYSNALKKKKKKDCLFAPLVQTVKLFLWSPMLWRWQAPLFPPQPDCVSSASAGQWGDSQSCPLHGHASGLTGSEALWLEITDRDEQLWVRLALQVRLQLQGREILRARYTRLLSLALNQWR